MPITILGSWLEDNAGAFALEGSRVEFVEACEAIGRALASREQQIIVGSDSQISADYHVVKGVVDRAGEDEALRPLVHVIRPESGRIFDDLWRRHSRLFTGHRGASNSEGAKIISVQDADAVLTIGGAEGTYRAGLAAMVARKTLVPIASFRGASRQLLDALEQFGQVRNMDEFGLLSGPWTPFVKDTALRLSGVTRPPRLLIIHGRSDDRYKLKDWLLNQDVVSSNNDVVVMGEEFGVGSALYEKFEELASDVDAAIAVATPDDKGGLETEALQDYRPRARQNVWLEVGWFWGRLGTTRIMILRKGATEIPSDLHGLEMHPYNENPSEKGDDIRRFVSKIRRA